MSPRQRVALDPPARRTYYAVLLGALLGAAWGCVRGPARIAPSGLEPTEAELVRQWLSSYLPDSARRYELRWRFHTPRGSTAGRAAVRVSPPDSLRFDYRGPFGRSGAAVVVGDSALWAEPEEETGELIPVAPLFWAGLGLPPAPPEGALVFAREGSSGRAWRYVLNGDTLDFVEVGRAPERLLSQLLRGRILATAAVRFQPGNRLPIEGEISFPPEGALFRFTVEAIESVASFDPSIWRRP
ncbi:MAG: hypothetical protein KatS3mg081_0402 [Gemmatimonadales bacterium]|nr:MAG: hypothetical protein KatS3mg081_0402 [Gemmatimonadales bacterium]